MLVAQNSLGPVCPVPLTVRGKLGTLAPGFPQNPKSVVYTKSKTRTDAPHVGVLSSRNGTSPRQISKRRALPVTVTTVTEEPFACATICTASGFSCGVTLNYLLGTSRKPTKKTSPVVENIVVSRAVEQRDGRLAAVGKDDARRRAGRVEVLDGDGHAEGLGQRLRGGNQSASRAPP